MKRAISREYIAKYWGTIEGVNVNADGASPGTVTVVADDGRNNSNNDTGDDAGAASTSGGPLSRQNSEKRHKSMDATYEYSNFEVMNELDTPIWLFDPAAKKNVWANEAAITLYNKTNVKEFLTVNMEDSTQGGSREDGGNAVDDSKMNYLQFCSTAMEVVEGIGRRKLQCHLPGLHPGSPQCDYLFTVNFRRVVLKSIEGNETSQVCLVSAESARLFDSLYQSLRALQMLKSSPIFSFLFTHDGRRLLTANPCAITFYEKYFNDKESLSLQHILSVGDWDSVAYPDHNGPPSAASASEDGSELQEAADRTVELCKHIEHVLFVEKFESFRVQMRMPKRQDPSKYRWVEFEMWAAKDPITKNPAILVNQTNLQETKKLEMELKNKHDRLKSRNQQLQVELEEAKTKGKGSLDLDSTVDKTIKLLDDFIAGKQPSESDILQLKQALSTSNLRAPNRLEEMLLSNKKGFEGEVGLSLFDMLNPDSQRSLKGANVTQRESSVKGLSGTFAMDLDAENEKKLQGSIQNVHIDEGGPNSVSGERIPKQVDLTAPILEVLDTVDGWCFNAFELEKVTGGRPMSTLGCYLFKRMNLLETFDFNEEQFFLFISKIESGYPDNAYHNRVHCADVLHSMYILLTRGLGPELAGDQEMVAGLLAAIIHDYEHKGVNNDFLVRFQDELALKYNDRSPLENHHIAASFEVMVTKPYDIFCSTNTAQFTQIRKSMIEMVLATDMKLHFDILGRFRLIEKKVADLSAGQNHDSQTTSSAATKLEPEDLSLCMQVALKCADIGHVFCNSQVHLRWVQKLEQEFFDQGDKEDELGVGSKSPLMDRDKAGITKSQCGFFKVVVLPLFKSFCTAFPSVNPILDIIEKNLALWAKIEEEQLEISEVFANLAPTGP